MAAEATSISEFNTDVVPGLLQVEGYARAIFEAAEPPHQPSTIKQLIEARMRRQAILATDDGKLFHFIVDEMALRRPVGGPAVMRAQLERIIEGAHPALHVRQAGIHRTGPRRLGRNGRQGCGNLRVKLERTGDF